MPCPFLRYDVKMRFCLARRSADGPAAIRPGDRCETTCGTSYDSCWDYRKAVWEGIIPLPRATSADGPEGTRDETVIPPAKPMRNGS